jgi:ATP-dependent helicase HrpB
LAEIRGRGCSVLPRWHEADGLRSRLAFLLAHGFDPGIDPAEESLTAEADAWLAPRLAFLGPGSTLSSIDVAGALWDMVDYHTRSLLDAEAPKAWTSPLGGEFPLQYGEVDSDPASVLMQVRLQKLIGVDDHPRIGSRHVPVTLELMSPANRALQRTQDLPGFWRGSYAQVRAEMRSRYRKHAWPERPWEPLAKG